MKGREEGGGGLPGFFNHFWGRRTPFPSFLPPLLPSSTSFLILRSPSFIKKILTFFQKQNCLLHAYHLQEIPVGRKDAEV